MRNIFVVLPKSPKITKNSKTVLNSAKECVNMWGSVKEFTESAAETKSVAALNFAFGKMARNLGFSNFVAIQVSSRQSEIRAPLARSFGHPPVLWLDRYREAGHVRRDVGIKQIMTSMEPFWWSELKSSQLSRDERQVFDEAAEYGLSHGLVVPVRQPDGSIWSCLLSAENVVESAEMKFAAVVAANYYVGRGSLLQSRESRKIDLAYRLTARQREVVTWISRGLTADEIGEVLGTSGRTVSHQLDDAKRRLKARTLASLVAEALAHGEIELLAD
jgi:DNA-binding CsgD family transcriptional regulator